MFGTDALAQQGLGTDFKSIFEEENMSSLCGEKKANTYIWKN